LDSIAKPIFFALHLVCAQIPSHSFYILGHQLGMCARNFSVYTAMFIGSLIFILTKKRMPGIPWWLWILMMMPIAWDGITQMFGLRESDWILRVVTGTIFGAGNIWFALPMMQKSLTETTVPQIPPALLQRYQRLGLVPATYGVSVMMPAVSTMSAAPQTSTVEIVSPVQMDSIATTAKTAQTETGLAKATEIEERVQQ
jgi:uncharacterized membrane protein